MPVCREVTFDEDADRMRRKLEEMSTISRVHVDLESYPSSTSGGWGGTAVDDGTEGGYVWKVSIALLKIEGMHFLQALHAPLRNVLT